MSWLAERKIQYLYRHPKKGDEIILEFYATDEPLDKINGYHKVEMLPYKVNLTFKVQFERNGYIGYKYDTGNGKPRTVSATRENYEKNVGNTPSGKLRELKAQGRMSELSPTITSKGYKKTYEKLKGVK